MDSGGTSGGTLHELAVGAERNLEALATGLAQSQVDPNTVNAVTKMAEVMRKLIVALGAGQESQPGAPTQGPAAQQPGAQPQPGQPQPGQPPAQTVQHVHTMDSATAALHQNMMAAAQQRAAQGH